MQSQVADQVATPHIKLKGSLAISQAPALQTQIIEALESGSPVCLDVSDATEIDIGFLQILVAAHKAALDGGKALTIAHRGADLLREQIARCGLPDSALPNFS